MLICFRLFDIALENLQGRVDEFVIEVIKHIKKRLEQQEITNTAKSSSFQSLCMCFYYNTGLTYKILEQTELTSPFFNAMCSDFTIHKSLYCTRVMIYGISEIL